MGRRFWFKVADFRLDFRLWMEHMQKLQEQAMKPSSYGEGSTMYKCPNCDAEYFSVLLMSFHMFQKHAITTRKT
jgi:hypothetical protein